MKPYELERIKQIEKIFKDVSKLSLAEIRLLKNELKTLRKKEQCLKR